jgi:sigma-B regulation protein RsbU (phosphoserine phosphatase)
MSERRSVILVVDDEPAMVHTVRRILGRDYEVIGASSAPEALQLAPDAQPDLAILDIRMPDMDGFDLMSHLREQLPGLDVIFMTGVVNELDAQLIRAIRERAFYIIQKPFDREVLLTLVERALELRRLAELNRRHVQRLEDELAEARAFQRSLLPPDHASAGGCTVTARYVPCDALGGDFYEFAAPDRNHATVLVADASGHGTSAAMFTAVVKSAFRASQADGYAPLDVVQRIASGIRAFSNDRFVTAICARVHTDRGMVEYVNAGHPPGVVEGDAGGEVRYLQTTGPLISPAFPDAVWELGRVDVGPGDRIVLYSDGILETEQEGPCWTG